METRRYRNDTFAQTSRSWVVKVGASSSDDASTTNPAPDDGRSSHVILVGLGPRMGALPHVNPPTASSQHFLYNVSFERIIFGVW